MGEKRFKRVFLLVMDGVGIGEGPDARDYGDLGSDTLGHVIELHHPATPALWSLGLYNIDGVSAGEKCEKPLAAYMRLSEESKGKDTTTGHWEICGIVLNKPFPTYPNGFPDDFISEFEKRIGVETLGNEAASGTEIIERLGSEHVATGKPIIYTSADSVLQLAAHEDVIPLERLYDMCLAAREMSQVGRVIARPFTGKPGSFTRTANRRDFSLTPPEPNLLTDVCRAGLECVGVGKIEDIFAHTGLTRSHHTADTQSSMEKTRELAKEDFAGLVFVNLIDFDMLYGHRNDTKGFAGALERFDGELAALLPLLRETDALIITADHGCDPATPSTDHSREYVPLLIYGKGIEAKNHGSKHSFTHVAEFVQKLLGIK